MSRSIKEVDAELPTEEGEVMEVEIVEIDEKSGIPAVEQARLAAEKMWGRGAVIVPMGSAALGDRVSMTTPEREKFELAIDKTVAVMVREAEAAAS